MLPQFFFFFYKDVSNIITHQLLHNNECNLSIFNHTRPLLTSIAHITVVGQPKCYVFCRAEVSSQPGLLYATCSCFVQRKSALP